MDVRLRQGLNILYGQNGAGKTTFLHVIANLLEADIERFTHVRFERIRVETTLGSEIVLERIHRDKTQVVAIAGGGLQVEIARGEDTPSSVRDVIRETLGGRAVYIPAFRTVLEAISRPRAERALIDRSHGEIERIRMLERLGAAQEEDAVPPARQPYYVRERQDGIAFKTLLCREWFGQFVPIVRFPSLNEVAEELGHEYQAAHLEVARRDRAAFSQVFVDVVKQVFEPTASLFVKADETAAILESIQQNLGALQETQADVASVYDELAAVMKRQIQPFSSQEAIATKILRLYAEALHDRVRAQRQAFRVIKTFQSSVNRFLNGKALRIGGGDYLTSRRSAARIRLAEGREAGLSVLSSGERHVLTLLFSATHMPRADGVVLIDEPELSLHVDWQRIILHELSQQAGERQIIACTHAPEVAADHREAMIRIASDNYRPRQDMFPTFGTTGEDVDQ